MNTDCMFCGAEHPVSHVAIVKNDQIVGRICASHTFKEIIYSQKFFLTIELSDITGPIMTKLTAKELDTLTQALGFYQSHVIQERKELMRIATEKGEWNKKEFQDLCSNNEEHYANLRDKLKKMEIELNQ
jgi:hypothetical protein